MHFTRDPIIETIITPKEGHKLSIRSNTEAKSEEYLVNAVEVITFGTVYFLRSLERPKAFLLPLHNYEVIEVREMKIPLQATSYEKAIKIPSKKVAKTEEKKTGKKVKRLKKTNLEKETAEDNTEKKANFEKETAEDNTEKKANLEKETAEDNTGKKINDEPQKELQESKLKKEQKKQAKRKAPKKNQELDPESSKKKLLPPPATLISETIDRYKTILLPEEETANSEEKT